MRCTVSRFALLAAADLCRAAASTHTTKPALCGLLLTATEPGTLTAVCTDGHRTLAYDVPGAGVLHGGRALVADPGKLAAVLKAHPEESVAFDLDPGDDAPLLELRFGRRDFARLNTLDPDQLPLADPPADPDPAEVPAAALAAAVDRTLFLAEAMEEDEQKPADYQTDGLLFDLAPDALTVVGTNGAELSAAPLPAACPGPARSGLVPRKAVVAMAAALKTLADAAPVRVGVTARGLTLAGGPWACHATLEQGRFLPWRRLLPAAGPAARVPAALTARAVRAVINVAEKDKAVALRVAGGTLSVSASSKTAGRGRVTLLDPVGGPDVAATLPGTGLARALDKCGDGTAVLQVVGGMSVVVRGPDGWACVFRQMAVAEKAA